MGFSLAVLPGIRFSLLPFALLFSQAVVAQQAEVPVPSGSVQAVKISTVTKSRLRSGTAMQLGLEPGDIIYAINGKSITSAKEMQAYIKGDHNWGEVIHLNYIRGQQAYEIIDIPLLLEDGFIKSHVGLLWGAEVESATIEVPAATAERGIIRQERGILLKEVQPNHLAGRAGLKSGDVILAIDNKLYNNPAYLIGAFVNTKSDAVLKILYLRDGKEQTAQATDIRRYSWGIKGESHIATLSSEAGPSVVETAAPPTSAPETKSAVAAEEAKQTASTVTKTATTQAAPALVTTPTLAVANPDLIPASLNLKTWRVTSVIADSPAAKAGVRAGDQIAQLNGYSAYDNASISALLPNFKQGQGVTLTLFRGSTALRVPVVLQTVNGANYLGIAFSPSAETTISGLHWPAVLQPELAPGLSYPLLQTNLLPAWNLYQTLIHTQPARTIHTAVVWRKDFVAPATLPCDGAPVDIIYGSSGGFVRFARLQSPTCSGNMLTSAALLVENNGRVVVAQVSMLKGNLVPKTTSTALDIPYFTDAHFYSGTSIIASQDSNGNLLLAKDLTKPFNSGTTLAYLSLKNTGYFDLEAGYGYYDLSKAKVFHSDNYTITADRFTVYYRQNEKELVTSFNGDIYVIKANGQQRWDTNQPSATGPAGTYYASNLRNIDKITRMLPAPGTLAQYARAVAKCEYKPSLPEGFLHWAGTCKPDSIWAYSIDGQFGIFFQKDKDVNLYGLDPEKPGVMERAWVSASITMTNPPLPIGKTEVYNSRNQLIYRGNLLGYNPDGDGECPLPDSKDFEPCTWKEGKRTDIAFLARERQRQLDAAAARQQQQATASMIAAQQQRNEQAAYYAEQARIAEQQRRTEEAAERREEEARSQARWAQTLNNISSTFAQSQAEVAANQQRAESLRRQQQAAQARTQQQQEDKETAYRRQQVQNINVATAKQEAIANQYAQKRTAEQQETETRSQDDAMARALAAQRAASQQGRSPSAPGTRIPVNTNAPSAQPKVPTNTQKAPATLATTNIAQSTAAEKAKLGSCISNRYDECLGQLNERPDTSTSNTTGKKTGTDTTNPPGLIDWPEGIAVCTQTKTGMRCGGPFTTTGDSVDQACSGSGTRHNYGSQKGYTVWGCGFGIDSPGKNDLFHQQNHRDMAQRYGLNLPDRRTYSCPAGQVTPTYCFKER